MSRPARRARRFLALCVVFASVACHPPRQSVPVDEPTPSLPTIPVYVIAPTDSGRVVPAPPSRDPIGELGADKLVSLTASNADARTLLLWLAQQAGVSLVVAPDVTARVSVSFTNVRASDAMRAILAEARLSILAPALQTPWPPVVFHASPLNIDDADVPAIMARFGVSLEMAKWIVGTRQRP